MTRLVAAAVCAALVVASCAPDPPDTYTAAEPPSETLPPLPTVAGVDDGASLPTFPPNGETVEVRALDNSFIEPTLEIDAGTEVRWVNGGRNDHDVLPVDDDLDWGVGREGFVPGDEYTHVFDQPGVYRYYCSIHGTTDAGMVGAVVVAEPA